MNELKKRALGAVGINELLDLRVQAFLEKCSPEAVLELFSEIEDLVTTLEWIAEPGALVAIPDGSERPATAADFQKGAAETLRARKARDG